MEAAILMESTRVENLWSEYSDRLLLFATSLVGDSAAAEDVLQGVFTRLLSGGSVPDGESESTYLFRAVRNEALNSLRSRRRFAKARQHLFDLTPLDPRSEAELAELRTRVEAVLETLPEEQREAVVLRVWGELSIPEGAAVAGVSEKTFEHRYYRGLAALEGKLGGIHE